MIHENQQKIMLTKSPVICGEVTVKYVFQTVWHITLSAYSLWTHLLELWKVVSFFEDRWCWINAFFRQDVGENFRWAPANTTIKNSEPNLHTTSMWLTRRAAVNNASVRVESKDRPPNPPPEWGVALQVLLTAPNPVFLHYLLGEPLYSFSHQNYSLKQKM